MTMISSVSFGCKNGIVETPRTPKTQGEVLKEWADKKEQETIETIKQKEKDGTISPEEKTYLNLTRVLGGLGGLLKPTVISLNGEEPSSDPAKDLYLNLLKGVKDLGLDKLVRIIPVGVNGAEKPETVEKQQAVEKKADKPLKDTLAEYGELDYKFNNLKDVVAIKRKDGTITEKEEGELNVTAMNWLIKTNELKKVLKKELDKRVENGLDPKVAQAISNSDLSLASVAAFMQTDESGNYIIPTKVLNKIGKDGIEFRENIYVNKYDRSSFYAKGGGMKSKMLFSTYKDGKLDNLGSIEYYTVGYLNDKYKDKTGHHAKIECNFNFLEIETSKGAEPQKEGNYKLTIPSTDFGIWVDKYGKLSELQ